MQMRAAAMYVGHPEVVTAKVIDRLRLGFQSGFWEAVQDGKTNYRVHGGLAEERRKRFF